MYKVLNYTPNDKMSALICDNYLMILVLNRFEMSIGFNESTISEVCESQNIDTNTFLAVVNLLISENKGSFKMDFSKISIECLLKYLKNSHSFFSGHKLPSIRQKLIESIGKDNAVSVAILNYFDEYVGEVKKHMFYEENVVFPYILNLINGDKNEKFNIDIFHDVHESVDSKLTELKNIIIKYYPAKTTHELSSVLFDIFNCKDDLLSHNDIEDYLLTPAIREIELLKTAQNGK